MEIVPFKKEHLKRMVIQQRQQDLARLITDEVCASVEGIESYTAIDGDEVIACAGAVQMDIGRALVWSYISANIKSRMIFVARAMKRFIAMSKYRRIEMHVDCEFKQAHRLAMMLGFEMEAERMKSFTPDGRDSALYALVR